MVKKTSKAVTPKAAKAVSVQHAQAKLTHVQVRALRKRLAAGVSVYQLAAFYEVNRNVIARIRDGLSYKNVV